MHELHDVTQKAEHYLKDIQKRRNEIIEKTQKHTNHELEEFQSLCQLKLDRLTLKQMRETRAFELAELNCLLSEQDCTLADPNYRLDPDFESPMHPFEVEADAEA